MTTQSPTLPHNSLFHRFQPINPIQMSILSQLPHYRNTHKSNHPHITLASNNTPKRRTSPFPVPLPNSLPTPHSNHTVPPPRQRVSTSPFNSLPTNVSKQTTHTIWETQYSRLFRIQSLIGLLRRSTIIPVSLHRLVMNRMIVVKYGVGEQEYLSFACLNSPSTNQDRRDTPDCRRISASVEKNARISIRRIRSLSTK